MGFAFCLTPAKGFVSDEEDFLEAATGVLRSIMDKMASLREPQVSNLYVLWALNRILATKRATNSQLHLAKVKVKKK